MHKMLLLLGCDLSRYLTSVISSEAVLSDARDAIRRDAHEVRGSQRQRGEGEGRGGREIERERRHDILSPLRARSNRSSRLPLFDLITTVIDR